MSLTGITVLGFFSNHSWLSFFSWSGCDNGLGLGLGCSVLYSDIFFSSGGCFGFAIFNDLIVDNLWYIDFFDLLLNDWGFAIIKNDKYIGKLSVFFVIFISFFFFFEKVTKMASVIVINISLCILLRDHQEKNMLRRITGFNKEEIARSMKRESEPVFVVVQTRMFNVKPIHMPL